MMTMITDLINDTNSKIDIHTTTPWGWDNNSVQPDTDAAYSGGFISADSSLVCAGPPRLPEGSVEVLKLGLTPNFSYSQHIPNQRITEIGSRRVHIIKGTPVGGGSISRLLYNGSTLLCMSYGMIFDEHGKLRPGAIQSLNNFSQDKIQKMWDSKLASANSESIFQKHTRSNFWISCWDDRLDFPIGLAVFHFDIAGKKAGGYYLEGVKYSAHNVSKQASQLVLAESMNFSFDRIVPIVDC